MLAATIRRRFLDFFVERGHREVPSASLVPKDDPTLLFTNAGMVQFKRAFLGLEHRDYRRAATAQKCVRAGGKHNDLEQVGHTDRHNTFFEMLGNFSFGDYFKSEAIAFAWEFVTSGQFLGIAPDRIRVSVHRDDADARRLWREVAGIADDRIYGLGDAENFWQMADTGPCGPCSEIYVDLQYPDAQTPGRPGNAEPLDEFVAQAEAGRFVELWNLVFMQYDRQPDGKLVPLPAPSVDTGAGLERSAAVMQNERSIFHTDLFLPLVERAEAVVGLPYDRGPAGAPFRVLADHARAVAFLLADGLYPSNEGRGYVLRRILRRAVRHAYLLGRREPTLVSLVDEVVRRMGDVYPELVQHRKLLAELTTSEEERFLATIEGGLERMEELTSVSAEEAFKLYDTYGFPIDLTQIVAGERGIEVDVAGFEKLLQGQRERSRAARKGAAVHGASGDQRLATGDSGPSVHVKKSGWTKLKPRVRQRWVGYDTTRAETDILAFQRAGDVLGLMLHENPFYAESGGQVSDRGEVVGRGWKIAIDEVRKIEGKTAVIGRYQGPFEPTPVEARVDEPLRRDTERNHTATHLVHAALRRILGTHVRQAGSVVAPDRLRFDFTHHQPVDAATLAAIEDEVNAHVWENLDVLTEEMPYSRAIQLGAMALFGEKYGDVVRVVTVPEVSRELCGGTHVRTTGPVGLVRLVSESGVGAGVRRLEALTGPGAFRWLAERQRLLEEAAEKLGSAPEHLARRVEALAQERRALEKRVEELIRGGGAQPEAQITDVNGTQVAVLRNASGDRNEIGAMVDAFRAKTRSGVVVILAGGERPSIHVGVTDDLVGRGVLAPDLVNRIAAVTGGRGGGRPHFASASTGDPARLAEAEHRALEIVRGVVAPRSA